MGFRLVVVAAALAAFLALPAASRANPPVVRAHLPRGRRRGLAHDAVPDVGVRRRHIRDGQPAGTVDAEHGCSANAIVLPADDLVRAPLCTFSVSAPLAEASHSWQVVATDGSGSTATAMRQFSVVDGPPKILQFLERDADVRLAVVGVDAHVRSRSACAAPMRARTGSPATT